MPIPNLIHPVMITFEIQDISDTLYDDTTREPVRQTTRKTQVKIKGQAALNFAGAQLDAPSFHRMGVEEKTSEYVSLRFKDMIKKGLLNINDDGNFDFVLKRGDRVICIGKRNLNLYVMGFEDFAHYPNISQSMIQINLSDRHPSVQTGNR